LYVCVFGWCFVCWCFCVFVNVARSALEAFLPCLVVSLLFVPLFCFAFFYCWILRHCLSSTAKPAQLLTALPKNNYGDVIITASQSNASSSYALM
jgi:hypothetical protein